MPSVLVVDDEDQIRQLIRETLEQAGYEVEEASNGNAALERLLPFATVDGYEMLLDAMAMCEHRATRRVLLDLLTVNLKAWNAMSPAQQRAFHHRVTESRAIERRADGGWEVSIWRE